MFIRPPLHLQEVHKM